MDYAHFGKTANAQFVLAKVEVPTKAHFWWFLMNASQIIYRCKSWWAKGVAGIGVVTFGITASLAQQNDYPLQPGDVATDFSTVLRRDWYNPTTDQTLSAGSRIGLEAFEGKVLFILFYDPFCVICLEGINRTATEIKDYYELRNGNTNGVPVQYMAINVEPAEYAFYEADYVLDPYSVELRANDYTETEVDISVNMFASRTSKPVFVAINCVRGSPGLQFGEVLINRSALVDSQILPLTETWKTVIETVQPALPEPPVIENISLRSDSTLEFTLFGHLNSTYHLASTTNLMNWDIVAEVEGTNGPIVFPFDSTIGPRRFFRIIRP